MELPNSHFQDFPIEFKEINPSDFPNFEVADKINLSLNNGYIGDSLIENLDINEKNTVILNCGVGSGKTTAIIKVIKEFYDDESYVVFVASPYLSLVQQYFTDIQEKAHIPENKIYRHEWIGESNIPFVDKRIHIVTINALLGNPGNDSLINSFSKRNYLNNMVRYCETNHKKVVFIYDEIHDSIHNFKEKFIFNLWKWRNAIHKNFIISATFNEASKVVIEYLAELTDCKIQILEAVREKIPERQSDLYLYFDNAINYTNENGNLISIIEDVFNREMDIDILSYSKILCKSILNNKETGAGKLLFDKYGEDNINDCTSGISDDNERLNRDYNKNRYNKYKCNIGTNYKSGVSIEKENHAFILIFPPYSASGDFKSKFGIFTGGINSIIQALARKRKVGEIHIILPRPTLFNFDSFPFTEIQKKIFKEYFEQIQKPKVKSSENGIEDKKLIEYIPMNNQDTLLNDFYRDELKNNVLDSIEYVEQNSANRTDKVRLQFPEYKLFKLEDGEKYLSNKYKFIGRDLSGYVCYAAATNQFVNCNWVSSNWKPIQNFKEGKLQYNFDKFFEEYFYEDENTSTDWFSSLMSQVTNKYVYQEIRNKIFNDYNIKLYSEDRNYKYINQFENKLFETQLIAFIQRKLFRNNIDFIRKYEQHNGWTVDTPYTRGDYFRSCIAHAHLLNQQEDLPEDTQKLVSAYLQLDRFRNKVIDSIQAKVIIRQPVRYISKVAFDNFISQAETEAFSTLIETLCTYDFAIKNELFDFKRFLTSNATNNEKIYRFYSYLKEDFFILKTRKIDNIDRDQVISECDIPAPNQVLDFISPVEILLPEEAMQELVIIDGIPFLKNTDGSFSSFGNSSI